MTQKKIAVLHLLPSPYRLPLFERLLADQEYDVRLFFSGRQAANRPTWSLSVLPEDNRVLRLPEIAFPGIREGSDAVRINLGLSKIFKWKPDLVLICGPNEPTTILAAFLCAVRGIPYAILAEVSASTNRSLRRRLYLPLMSFLVKRASWLGPASESCARFFEETGGTRRSMTILPCVPDYQKLVSIRRELASNREALKQKHGLKGRFVLLFVGRLVENKGVVDLLESMRGVAARSPKVTLAVVGYGPMADDVKRYERMLGDSIRYFGLVDDSRLYELYSIADAHIMPSWSEPYGVVCAEALSFGVPSIITTTSGCRDLIIDGVNGYMIPPNSPKDIEETVMKIVSNPDIQSSMRSNAESTMRNLTMDHLYQSLKQVIASALSD